MQFLRTLFWVVLAIVAVIFAMRNWQTVQVSLWGGMVADAKLPVLLFAALLIGLVPMFVLQRTTRWRLRRRLDQAERGLAEARATLATLTAEPVPPLDAPPPIIPSSPAQVLP